MDYLVGEVYAYDSGRGVVAVRVGLSPKVIRFNTTRDWKHAEKVRVYIGPHEEEELITVEASID